MISPTAMLTAHASRVQGKRFLERGRFRGRVSHSLGSAPKVGLTRVLGEPLRHMKSVRAREPGGSTNGIRLCTGVAVALAAD